MKFTPHGYQRYCIERLINEPALGLFLSMGLGKTVIALTAINDLRYNRFAVRRTLVIAPKKVAEITWMNEAAKWEHLHMLRVTPVLGTAGQRVRALHTPGDVWVINRENVAWLVDYYRHDWPFDTVIVDELSSFKNHQAKRFKALMLVRDRIQRIVGLTGTPAPNGLIDLWAQVYLLDKGERLGKRIGQFRERYFDPGRRSQMQVFDYKPKLGADEAIRQLLGDICVSMRAEDYLQLPDCIYNTIPVRLDTRAKAAYQKLERDMLLEIDAETIDASTAAVLSNKLLQLCNGAVYNGEQEPVEVHDCKVEAFIETVEALNGAPALVFYAYRHDLARMQKALAGTGLRVRVLESPENEAAWNRREIDILLAHPASCAYGLNLQAGGNHIIWFGLTWSLEQYLQANARVYRQGQAEKVFIHHLVVEGGMDEDVMAALSDKEATQERLLSALRVRIDKARGTS